MYPIIFSIGELNIYSHGLLIAIGAVLGGLIIFYLAKKRNLSRSFLFDVLVYSLFAGIIGGRILYVIFYYYQFPNWHDMFLIWKGGLVSLGGVLLGFFVAFLILKRHNQNILRWFDIGIIGLLFGWSMGRIGCFLTGDVPGIISTGKIVIWGRIPISLYESILCLILGIILFYLYFYRKNIIEKFSDGFIFFIGLAGYSLGRFVIDFWRQERMIGFVKIGQIGTLVIFLAVIVILYFYYLKPYYIQHKTIEE